MSLQKKDIEHLSMLARVAISDEEAEHLATKIEAVLAYVGEINAVDTSMYEHAKAGELRNVLREDVSTTDNNEERATIVKNAPKEVGGFIKVQQMFE